MSLKLQAVSDLHCEFHKSDGGRKLCQKIAESSKDVDVLIVAGDLGLRNSLRLPISIFADKYKDVVYVPGNHEYYNSNREEIHELLQECTDKYSNFHWLNNQVKEIQGKRFVGSTLWFPDNATAKRMTYWLTDFQVIDEFEDWIWQEFEKNKAFLSSNIQSNDIVVTHHIPCWEGVHPTWQGEESNCYFVGDVSDIIETNKPKFWCFGHTHSPMQFKMHDTLMYCNPHGYPHEGVRTFEYNQIIVVPS